MSPTHWLRNWQANYKPRAMRFMCRWSVTLRMWPKALARRQVVDASNPAQPSLSLSGLAGTSVHGLQVVGNLAFLADRRNGLVVSELLGLAPLPPVILQQPGTISGVTGSNQVISVLVEGMPPLSFQWYKENIVLADSSQILGLGGAQPSLPESQRHQCGQLYAGSQQRMGHDG